MFLLPEFHLLLGHAEEGVGQGGALRLTGAEQADFPDIALFQREQLDLTPGQTVPQGQARQHSDPQAPLHQGHGHLVLLGLEGQMVRLGKGLVDRMGYAVLLGALVGGDERLVLRQIQHGGLAPEGQGTVLVDHQVVGIFV